MTKSFDELALISVPYHRQTDPDGAERFLLLAQAAAECLTEFGLCKINVAEKFRADPDVFEILLGELTPEGVAFARTGFQRWLASTDRWKAEATLEKFKQSLDKQWEKNRACAF
jgi:hypothetical protein